MYRLTKRSENSDMVWFVDYENDGIALEPCSMNSHHSRMAISRLADCEDVADRAHIVKSDYCHQRIVSFRPIESHYENKGEPPYIKYSCPICNILGNRHQIGKNEKNCPLCGVNFKWGNDSDDEE